MTESDQIEKIWALATTQGPGWKNSDNPCVRAPSKKMVLESWRKTVKYASTLDKPLTSDELLAKIELLIPALSRMRRDERAANQQVSQPVMLSVFLNQARWEVDDIGSHAELKSEKTRTCPCGQPQEILSFCQKCYESVSLDHKRAMEDLRGSFKRNFMVKGEPPDERDKRLKAIGQAALANARDLLKR